MSSLFDEDDDALLNTSTQIIGTTIITGDMEYEYINDNEEELETTHTAASYSSAAASSSPVAASPSPPPSASQKVAPLRQSRSGRTLQQPKPIYALPSAPTTKSAAASTSANAVPADSTSTSAAKPKSRSRKNNSGGGGGKRNARSNKKTSTPAEIGLRPPDASGYRGEGFSVRDHNWYEFNEIQYASPPIEHLHSLYKEITCEEACQQAGLIATRKMRVEISNSTKEKLKQCLSAEHEKGEKDKTVLALCDSGLVRGCALFQSDANDVDSIKVVTTKFIRDKEVLMVYMGRLVEASRFLADYGDQQAQNVSSYDIPQKLLPDDYTGPPLLLDTNVCANEAKFIRDAKWNDYDICPNVQCRIVWNHAQGLPFVALVALGDIACHAELFVDWGDAAWSTYARGKLHKMAHNSYEQHFRLRQLQRELASYGIQPWCDMPQVQITDDVAFENFHYKEEEDERREKERDHDNKQESMNVEIIGEYVVPPSLTAAAAASSSFSSSSPPTATVAAASPSSSSSLTPTPPSLARPLEGIMRRVPPPPSARGHAPTFVLRNTKHVFDNCGIKLMVQCDYISLSIEATNAWQLAAKKCAAKSVQEFALANMKPALRQVLETGRCPKAAVYEVVSLRHPARFYSPPDCPTYALLAREPIEKGEPIGVYVGKVHEAKVFHGDYKPEDRIKQVYAYNMDASLFDGIGPVGSSNTAAASSSSAAAASSTSSPSMPPDLVCESLSVGGNETRFVNDSWCRVGGANSKNAEAVPTFDPFHNMPVMVICAVRRIEKGEEIVTDYGETFWCKISTALCLEHQAFQQKAAVQIQEAKKALLQILAPNTSQSSSPPNASAAAASSTSSSSSSSDDSDFRLPRPPDRMTCYRDLYNQYDVLYSHRPPPVRYDPQRHHDQIPLLMANSSRLRRREEAAKQREKTERQIARAEAAARKAAEAAAVAKQPKKKPPSPVAKPQRASARVSTVQHTHELEKKNEAAAREARVRAEREARRAERLRAKLEQKLSPPTEIDELTPAESAQIEAMIKKDQNEAMKKQADTSSSSAAKVATSAASSSAVADHDSDVELISPPPPRVRQVIHPSLLLSQREIPCPCPCGTGATAKLRMIHNEGVWGCRDCWKKRFSEKLNERSAQKNGPASNQKKRSRASVTPSVAPKLSEPEQSVVVNPNVRPVKNIVTGEAATVVPSSSSPNHAMEIDPPSTSPPWSTPPPSSIPVERTERKERIRPNRNISELKDDINHAKAEEKSSTPSSPRSNPNLPFKRAKLDDNTRPQEESKHNLAMLD